MLRIVDLVPALERRGYAPGPPARLVLRVSDPAAPWNAGVWRLEVEAGKARVTPAGAEPDLTTDIGTLSPLSTGYLSPPRALQAGLLGARDAATLATASRVFAVHTAPFCPDHF